MRPRLLAAIAVTAATAFALSLAGCAPARPAERVAPAAQVTCYAPDPDAGACHGNIYVPS